MTVDERLRNALAEEAATVPEPRDRWAEVEAQAAVARRVRMRRRQAFGISTAAVAAVAAVLLLVVPVVRAGHGRRVIVHGLGPRPTSPVGSTPGSSVPGASPTSVPTPTSVVAGGESHYLPLFPFATVAQANAATDSWHFDANGTALRFARYLGYNNITYVTSTKANSTGAHVGVGFPNPSGQPVTAAVVHLRRFGAGAGAPWEVVGTDDSASFSVNMPVYGSALLAGQTSLSVGGAVSGVDLSIRVSMYEDPNVNPVGSGCCVAAGNSGRPWHEVVTLPKSLPGGVLVVAASAGGGLSPNGQFAVTGVRVGSTPAVTPGL